MFEMLRKFIVICAALAFSSNLEAETRHRSTWCASCERTPSGRIKRSSSARRGFRMANPCPSTNSVSGPCPGYTIDHITPLKRGGIDRPDNMQWQSISEAREKDRRE
jgi:hypothetical protein